MRRRVWSVPLVVVLALAAAPVAIASPSTEAFLAGSGCAMAHCDQAMSDLAGGAPPTAIGTSWHDTAVNGSGFGLGCSSNRTVAVCSLAPSLTKWTTLRAYRGDGSVAWSSSLLNGSASASAPMVGPDGSAIVADDTRIARIGPSGAVAWQRSTPGGTPISPNITDDGTIVLATAKGPVSAFDAATGTLVASVRLADTVTIGGRPTAGYFDTVNTPAIRGNRIYVATQFRENGGTARNAFGRLYALDLSRSATTGSLSVAWKLDFRGPSGASPLVLLDGGVPTVYVDAAGLTPGATTAQPQFLAVRDTGGAPAVAWSFRMQTQPQASAAADPRGGLWVFSPFRSTLTRLDQSTGAPVQTIDVDPLVNQPGVHGPSSALTVTAGPSGPVMLLTATPPLFQSSYALAIDLVTGRALWSRRIDESRGAAGVSYGQFPVVERADGRRVVIFTTYGNGSWGLAAP